MKGILADVNIQGYVDLLVARMQVEPWKLFWDHRKLRYLRFADVGLAPESPDNVVWHACQTLELILLTDNRNDESPDSLESTIRSATTPQSLPVFTIGDVQRLKYEHAYGDQIVERLLIYLLDIDVLRGCGRLFLP